MTLFLWCLAGACLALLVLGLLLLRFARPPRPPTLDARQRAVDAEIREGEWRAGGRKW